MRNNSFQFPHDTVAQPAMIGARNEAIALTNCPKVKVLAKRFPLTIFDKRGFRDTCISVFPMPSSEKEINMLANE